MRLTLSLTAERPARAPKREAVSLRDAKTIVHLANNPALLADYSAVQRRELLARVLALVGAAVAGRLDVPPQVAEDDVPRAAARLRKALETLALALLQDAPPKAAAPDYARRARLRALDTTIGGLASGRIQPPVNPDAHPSQYARLAREGRWLALAEAQREYEALRRAERQSRGAESDALARHRSFREDEFFTSRARHTLQPV